MSNDIINTVGYISLVTGIITAVILFIKALVNSISEESAAVITLIGGACLSVGLLCVHNESVVNTISIIFFIIGGAAGVGLLIRAFAENINNLGTGILFCIFVVMLGAGFLLLKVVLPEVSG